jgi:hypothetical protein
MEPVSNRFIQSIVDGANAVCKFDVLQNKAIVKQNLLVESGSISIDATAEIRRSLRASIVDEDGSLTPRLATDLMMPFGTEAFIHLGFSWPDGTSEYVDMGIFRFETVKINDKLINITEAYDRSFAVSQARFERPWVIPASTNLRDAIVAILNSRLPGLNFGEFGSSSLLLPVTVFEEGDKSGNPWKNCQDLAELDSQILYFNVRGNPVMRPKPDPLAGVPVYTFSRGATSTLLGAEIVFTASNVRNVFIVSGEGSGLSTPLRSSSEISDASSPIFPGGSFGRRPDFFSSPLLLTQQAVDVAAQTRKKGGAGASEVTQFRGIPNPALEGGDVVRLVDSTIGLDITVVLSRFDMNLRMNNEVQFETLGRRWF